MTTIITCFSLLCFCMIVSFPALLSGFVIKTTWLQHYKISVWWNISFKINNSLLYDLSNTSFINAYLHTCFVINIMWRLYIDFNKGNFLTKLWTIFSSNAQNDVMKLTFPSYVVICNPRPLMNEKVKLELQVSCVSACLDILYPWLFLRECLSRKFYKESEKKYAQ